MATIYLQDMKITGKPSELVELVNKLELVQKDDEYRELTETKAKLEVSTAIENLKNQLRELNERNLEK